MTVIVGLAPAPYGFCREAPVRKTVYKNPAVLQTSMNFIEHLERANQVIDGHAADDAVEAGIFEGKLGVQVQIMLNPRSCLPVFFQLDRVHPERNQVIWGVNEMTYPGTHNVQDSPSEFEFLVEGSDRGNRIGINVSDNSRLCVEVVVR